MPIREAETENAMPRTSEPSRPTPDATPLDIVALVKRAASDESGATSIEYALIAAGIGAAVAATVFTLGDTTTNMYQRVANIF
jgi:pilus assembly protein Flp/PilA